MTSSSLGIWGVGLLMAPGLLYVVAIALDSPSLKELSAYLGLFVVGAGTLSAVSSTIVYSRNQADPKKQRARVADLLLSLKHDSSLELSLTEKGEPILHCWHLNGEFIANSGQGPCPTSEEVLTEKLLSHRGQILVKKQPR